MPSMAAASSGAPPMVAKPGPPPPAPPQDCSLPTPNTTPPPCLWSFKTVASATMEDAQDPGGWGDHFRAFMMSAPVDADLLNAANWTSTNRLSHDATNWTGTGWLEGNAVVTPTGNIVDILRVAGVEEIAAIVNISSDGTTASFDPANDFIPFHGGAAKFTIRHDPTSNRYWSLVNKQDDPDAFRNHLVLVSSADLRNWIVEDTVLFHPDTVNHAWQYIDWLFEGDDIVFVSRTAYDDGLGGSAHNAHDANFMTFHRIVNFRGPRAPVFDLHPRDQRVALGAPACFSVAAHDAITAFQWFKLVPDGPDLPLADDTQYSIVSTADSSGLTILDVAAHDLGHTIAPPPT